jgi:hypothetical protein
MAAIPKWPLFAIQERAGAACRTANPRLNRAKTTFFLITSPKPKEKSGIAENMVNVRLAIRANLKDTLIHEDFCSPARREGFLNAGI